MFDIYFAGAQTPFIDSYIYNLGANRLYSYMTEKRHVDRYIELLKTKQTPSKLIVDSGAFSAWTRGKTLDVDEYIGWINERHEHLTAVGQMDCIPGTRDAGATIQETKDAAEKTWENYLYMRERVENPDIILYTYHIGEPVEFLINALEWKDENGNGIPYMAFGGLVGKPRPIRDEFLTMAFSKIQSSSNPKIKVHGFGMTDYTLCEKYPVYSADSTTWILHGSQGRIRDDRGLYFIISEQQKHSPDHLLNLKPQIKDHIMDLIETNGFNLEQLMTDYNYRLLFNMRMMYYHFNKIDNSNRRVARRGLFG